MEVSGHPTEYFGKISVRMEGNLKISKQFFPTENRYVSLEFLLLECLLVLFPLHFGRFSLLPNFLSDVIITKAAKSFGEKGTHVNLLMAQANGTEGTKSSLTVNK